MKPDILDQESALGRRHLTEIRRVAEQFGAGFYAQPRAATASGVLIRGRQHYRAVCATDPQRVRLTVPVARLPDRDPLLATLLELPSASLDCRFGPLDDLEGTLMLEASMPWTTQAAARDKGLWRLFRDVTNLLWSDRLHAALQIARAQLCVYHTEGWF
jgi:hypothetical protein